MQSPSNRARVLIILASAENPGGFTGAQKAAEILKESGVTIITVIMEYSGGVNMSELSRLATPGYNYTSKDYKIQSILRTALLQSK